MAVALSCEITLALVIRRLPRKEPEPTVPIFTFRGGLCNYVIAPTDVRTKNHAPPERRSRCPFILFIED